MSTQWTNWDTWLEPADWNSAGLEEWYITSNIYGCKFNATDTLTVVRPPKVVVKSQTEELILKGIDGTVHFFEGHLTSEGTTGVQGKTGKVGTKGNKGPVGEKGPDGVGEFYPVSTANIGFAEVLTSTAPALPITPELGFFPVVNDGGKTFTIEGGFTYVIDVYVYIYGNNTDIELYSTGLQYPLASVTIRSGVGGDSMHAVVEADSDTTLSLYARSTGAYVIEGHLSVIKLGAGPTGPTGDEPTGAQGAQGPVGDTGPQGPPAAPRAQYDDYYA